LDGKACVVCGSIPDNSDEIEMRFILESGKTEPVCIYCGAKYDEACQEAAANNIHFLSKEQHG
jgi:hypothetical protein